MTVYYQDGQVTLYHGDCRALPMNPASAGLFTRGGTAAYEPLDFGEPA